jgi:hypothetical protein
LKKENFDTLEREILTYWKEKYWQFGKRNFDSLKKENFDTLERANLSVWKGKFLNAISRNLPMHNSCSLDGW